MAKPRRRTWPPSGLDPWQTSIDYLAYVAAKPELERRARSGRTLLMRIAGSGGTLVHGSQEWRQAASDKLRSYVVACYAVAQRFTGEDRNVLCLSGALPRSFFDDVEAEVARLRREARGARRREQALR